MLYYGLGHMDLVHILAFHALTFSNNLGRTVHQQNAMQYLHVFWGRT